MNQEYAHYDPLNGRGVGHKTAPARHPPPPHKQGWLGASSISELHFGEVKTPEVILIEGAVSINPHEGSGVTRCIITDRSQKGGGLVSQGEGQPPSQVTGEQTATACYMVGAGFSQSYLLSGLFFLMVILQGAPGRIKQELVAGVLNSYLQALGVSRVIRR